tara:strand:+ start:151 stop:303 length:153 start_codon:yes stop_codon:yes gene_type:complete
MENEEPIKPEYAVPQGPAPEGMDILAKIKAEKEKAQVDKPEPKPTKKSGK